MPSNAQRFLRKVRSALWTLKGKTPRGPRTRIQRWYRRHPRIACALEIVKSLLKEGCGIRAYDPAAIERAQEVLPSEGVIHAKSAYEAANGADALLILTDWPEFAKLDLPRA